MLGVCRCYFGLVHWGEYERDGRDRRQRSPREHKTRWASRAGRPRRAATRRRTLRAPDAPGGGQAMKPSGR